MYNGLTYTHQKGFLNVKKGMYSIAFAMLFTVCAIIVTQCVRSETHQGATSGQGGIILGFSQIGAESAWRKCNTGSIQQAAEESGVQLLLRMPNRNRKIK